MIFENRLTEVVDEFLCSLDSVSPAHGLDHLQRVWRNCKVLQKKYGGDQEVLCCASFLHDLGRHSVLGSHGLLGAKLAEPILGEISFPKEKTQLVLDAIRLHDVDTDMGMRVDINSQILFDADKLDSLGAVGVKRWVLHMQTQEISFDLAVKDIHARFSNMHFPDDIAFAGQKYLLDFMGQLRHECCL